MKLKLTEHSLRLKRLIVLLLCLL